jgi:hypothetical protein
VGGVTDEEARTVELSFDFLTEGGKEYVAKVYADAEDADYQSNPEAYVIYEGRVESTSTHTIKMARGGGFAISIREVTPEDKMVERLK